MAYHDRLTGLPNRAMFDQHLGLVLARARHDGGAAALLFMDIDRFKHVNDTLGHEAGDELLRQVGERLRRAARNSDLVVRLGGDELAIVLSDLERETASTVAERVARRGAGRVQRPFDLGGRMLQTSASIGIAIHPGTRPTDAELVSAADRGMYQSKRAGPAAARSPRWATRKPPEPGTIRRRWQRSACDIRVDLALVGCWSRWQC